MDSATYFDLFVVPNFRAYWAVEENLTEAFKAKDASALEAARGDALRAGMNAAVAAYHFADAVFESRPSWLGSAPADLAGLRHSVETRHCLMMRTSSPATDLTVLGAVVDAYKHFELRSTTRPDYLSLEFGRDRGSQDMAKAISALLRRPTRTALPLSSDLPSPSRADSCGSDCLL